MQNHISQLDSTSMAQVLASIVGGWGSTLVNIGLIISVLGAWLGWTLLVGELPFIVAKMDYFQNGFAKENKNGAPVNALLITNILVQLFFNKYAIYTECVSICIFTSIKCYFIPLHVQCILPSKIHFRASTASNYKTVDDWYHSLNLCYMAYICSRYQLLIIDDVTLYSSSSCLFNRSKE